MSPPNALRAKASRLRAMGWDELFSRLKQEVWKRRDAWAWRLGAGSIQNELRRRNGVKKNAHRTVADTPLTSAATSPPQFFFDAGSVELIGQVLRDRLPQQAEAILSRADSILRHRFDLLGYKQLDWGSSIDTQRDRVSGKRAPRKPWYRIPFLDYNVVGDHKIVWELNRHQHLVTLAKAHVLTQEPRWVSELVSQWRQWRKENPYPWGINWASSLEIAFRSLSWLWVASMLSGSSALSGALQAELDGALALNARHIERNLSTYWSPNTHLLGEGVALFFIGLLRPSFHSAARWRELGWRVVLEQAGRQVQPDGTHFEQSIYYHVYALDFLLHARILAARNGIPIPQSLDETVIMMLEALQGLSQAGPPPRIGDDDGGRLFDPARNRAEHLLDPLCLGSVLYHRPEFKRGFRDPTEETVWLFGPEGVRNFDALEAPALAPASRSFADGGCYVMAGASANGESDPPSAANPAAASARPGLQLVIRAPSRIPGRCGHSHADALSLVASAGGDEWLTDPGSFCYVSANAERDLFRSTQAHNTLQLDNLSQAEPAGPFAWRAMPAARVENWIPGQYFDLFIGSHDGYRRLDDPATHRRCIFHRKGEFWLVRDVVEGKGEHRLDLFWHFAPRLVPSYTPPGFTLSPVADSGLRGAYQGFLILPVEAHGWSAQIVRGHVSPAYGSQEPAAVVRFTTQAVLPAEFTAILEPLPDLSHEARRLVMAGPSPDRSVRAFRYNRGSERHWFFIGSGAQGWKVDSWTSDARFVYSAVSERTASIDIALCSGSYLAFDGQPVATADARVERLEIRVTHGETQTFCSDSRAVVRCDAAALASALNS